MQRFATKPNYLTHKLYHNEKTLECDHCGRVSFFFTDAIIILNFLVNNRLFTESIADVPEQNSAWKAHEVRAGQNRVQMFSLRQSIKRYFKLNNLLNNAFKLNCTAVLVQAHCQDSRTSPHWREALLLPRLQPSELKRILI